MSGSISAKLEIVALAILELVAFNAEKSTGSRDWENFLWMPVHTTMNGSDLGKSSRTISVN